MDNKAKVEEAKKANIKCVALGSGDGEQEYVEFAHPEPANVGERVTMLEQRISLMTRSIDALFSTLKEMREMMQAEKDGKLAKDIENKSRDGKAEIPEGTVLWGTSRGLNFFMSVKDGAFYIGNTKYDSPSAAAEAISGVRRSGWTFWKLPDGRSIKEVYKK